MSQDRRDLAAFGGQAEGYDIGQGLIAMIGTTFGQASPKVGQAPDHQKETWYIAAVSERHE
jgi:hypothetical protein